MTEADSSGVPLGVHVFNAAQMLASTGFGIEARVLLTASDVWKGRA